MAGGACVLGTRGRRQAASVREWQLRAQALEAAWAVRAVGVHACSGVRLSVRVRARVHVRVRLPMHAHACKPTTHAHSWWPDAVIRGGHSAHCQPQHRHAVCSGDGEGAHACMQARAPMRVQTVCLCGQPPIKQQRGLSTLAHMHAHHKHSSSSGCAHTRASTHTWERGQPVSWLRCGMMHCCWGVGHRADHNINININQPQRLVLSSRCTSPGAANVHSAIHY